MTYQLEPIEFFMVLLLVAIAVGTISQRIRLPYTVALVLVGIGLKALGLVPNIELTRELLMVVFLPALVFEAAIHFPANELKEFSPTIVTLAAPGVMVTALVTAILLQFEFTTFGVTQQVSFSHFLLFGTIIAATDPISVITLLRQLGIDRRIALLIEGESLFNDATAIVLYGVVLTAIETGSFGVAEGFLRFFLAVSLGIGVGALLGLLCSFFISVMEDHLFCTALTILTAYSSYLLAEQVHGSGILATAVAGLFIGNIGKRRIMSPEMRQVVASFWEVIAFFLSTLVFLLLGLEVQVPLLFRDIDLIALAFMAVLASRAATVFLPLPILQRLGQPVSPKIGAVVWWAGLRGSLSMVLVLSLPEEMPARDALIAMTFGVVVLSVVIQGTTMGPLLRYLGFVPKHS